MNFGYLENLEYIQNLEMTVHKQGGSTEIKKYTTEFINNNMEFCNLVNP